MIITAKFSSTCPTCNGSIALGSKVEWERGEKAKHVACAGGGQVAPSATMPAATATATRTITVERVGRRSYLRGDTMPVRALLKAGGCHWDAEQKGWWIGDSVVAEALAEKARSAPAQEAPSRSSETYGYGRASGAYGGRRGGAAASVAGYSSWCTDRPGCGCYDCSS